MPRFDHDVNQGGLGVRRSTAGRTTALIALFCEHVAAPTIYWSANRRMLSRALAVWDENQMGA
jgi:hypothetical protein